MARREDEGLFPLRLAWIIPVAGLVTLALGTWGWLGQHLPFDEALYRAAALFEINNDAYSQGAGLADWRFRIGRWTGAGAVFTGLIALAALLRERLATALARWTRQAVVVVGAGDLASAAFEAARAARRSALWLGASAFDTAGWGAIALEAPPLNRASAVRDHCRGADHVLVVSKDDAEALVFARAARAGAPKAYITVMMRDGRLAEEAAATLNEARTRVLSTGAVAARALMAAHPPFLLARQGGQARVHALILGFGQTGQSIARDLIVNGRTTFLGPPRITVIDPAAGALEGALRVRAPEIDACADCVFIEGEVGARAVRPAPDRLAEALAQAGPITAAYVCLGGDAGALEAAAMLQSLLRTLAIAPPPIFVRLKDARVIEPGRGDGLDSLIPFGDLASLLAASEFLSDVPDETARAYCEAYRAALTPALRDDAANRSARPWDRLDETYRQANRDAVAHIPAKLASAGVDPARWRGVVGLPRLAPGARLFSSDAELEALAALEHERWMAQRRMEGWRWTGAAAKDEALRLHPSLVPYEALTDEVKGYDRAYIRQTQDACRPDG